MASLVWKEGLEKFMDRENTNISVGNSIIDMMSVLGKPVNITEHGHGWLGELQVSAALVTAENIWFVSGLLNCLCIYDIDKQKITVAVNMTEEEPDSCLGGYCKLFEFGEWIWLLPGTASRIAKYHKADGRLDFLEIPNLSKSIPGKLNFYSAVAHEEEIWLLPYIGNQILCINTGNDEVKSIGIQEEKELKLIAGTLCGNRIFAFEEDGGRLVMINCESHDFSVHWIAGKGAQFAAMQYDEKRKVLWMFARETAQVYRICPESLQLDVISLKGIDGKEMNDLYYNSAFWNGKIWITARNEKPLIWEFDPDKQEIKSHDYYTGHARLVSTIEFLGVDGAIEVSHDGQELFVFPGQFDKFLILRKNGERTYCDFKLDKDNSRLMLINKLKHYRGNITDIYRDVYWFCTLSEYIELIIEGRRELSLNQRQAFGNGLDKADKIGERILNNLLNEVPCHEEREA